MQWRGNTNKSQTKINAAEIKFATGDLFTNGENHFGKTHWVNLRSPLPRIHYYQSQAVTSIKNLSTQYQSTVEPLPQYPIGLVL